jgi:tetratricopeptide (TPR) repeat protein
MSDHIIFILRLWAMGICLICTEQINAQVNLPKVLDSLEHTLDTMPSTVAKAKRLNQIAFFYLNIDAQKTREYARKGLALAEQVQSDEQIGQAHNALASYHVYASERENAVASYELAMQYFRKIGYEKGIANILGNLGVMHYVSGEYAKALDYIFQSLKVFEKIGDPLGQGNELSAAANIYMEQKKFDLAIHYDTLALKQYQKINDSNGIALVTGNLANIYKDIGETTKAKTAYHQALAIYRKTGDAQGIARNLVNFALFLHTERNYADASRNLSEAKEIFRKVNSNQGLTHATGNQGLSHFLSYLKYHRKDSLFILVPGSRESLLTKAISLLEESIRLSQKSNDLNGLVTYAKILSNAYSEKQDVANAFKYFKIYASAQDSLSSIDSKKAIEKLTTEREVELKNKQIELDRLAVEKKRNERAYFGAGMCLHLSKLRQSKKIKHPTGFPQSANCRIQRRIDRQKPATYSNHAGTRSHPGTTH